MHFTNRIANYISSSGIILLTLIYEGTFAGLFSNLFVLGLPETVFISSLLHT